MRSFLTVILTFLLVALVVSAMAVNDNPQPSAEPEAAPTASSMPDIPENAAEREAVARGELQLDPVPQGQVGPALSSPMIAEIQALIAELDLVLADLTSQIENAANDEIAHDLQLRAQQLKRDSELGILDIQLRYAREAGNVELAEQIEETIERIVNPPAPTAPSEPRPAPDNQR